MIVLEFVNASIRHIIVSVIHYRSPLIVGASRAIPFHIQGSPIQTAQTILKKLINGPGIHYGTGEPASAFGQHIGVACIQPHLYFLMSQQVFEQVGIAMQGNPLMGIGKVTKVVGITHWQPGDNGCGKFARSLFPLLDSVPSDKCLEQGPPYL